MGSRCGIIGVDVRPNWTEPAENGPSLMAWWSASRTFTRQLVAGNWFFFVFPVIVFLIAFLLLAAAVAWGPHPRCPLQLPKIVGCAFGHYESLSGGLIGGASVLVAAWLAWTIGQRQVRAVRRQVKAERRRSQQIQRQKRYAIVFGAYLEAQRIATSAKQRINLMESAISNGYAFYYAPQQLMISVFPLLRGDREEIGLLPTDLQDKVMSLIQKVDLYNSHIETRIPDAEKKTIRVEPALEKAKEIFDVATKASEEFNSLIAEIRSRVCKKCDAYLDERLDFTEDGNWARCPNCGNQERVPRIHRLADGLVVGRNTLGSRRAGGEFRGSGQS